MKPGRTVSTRRPVSLGMLVCISLLAVACGSASEPATETGSSSEEASEPRSDGQEKALVLFTDEEAEQLRLEPGDEELDALPKSSEGDGPVVELVTPEALEELTQPFPLHVRFDPRDSPVDLDTLEVRGKKGLFSKNITDRVRPFFTVQGINEDAVCLKTGKFRLEIKISDEAGRETKARFNVHIAAESDEDFCEAFREAAES